MEPIDGFQLANWDKGFGDFEMQPGSSDLARPALAARHRPGDLRFHACTTDKWWPKRRVRFCGDSSMCSQRRKFTCNIASELEFFLFNTTYHDAFAADYRDLLPPAITGSTTTHATHARRTALAARFAT